MAIGARVLRQGRGHRRRGPGPVPGNRGLPVAVVELKGAMTDLDRDRSNGRTAVQQCWDYLNALPGCPWGIVSNFRTIRLYHREKGTLSYEEFDLQELRTGSVSTSSIASSSAAGCCLRGSANHRGRWNCCARRRIARRRRRQAVQAYQWRRLN